MSEVPEMSELSEEESNCAMHIALPLANGQTLMASDVLPSHGHVLEMGNNSYISIAPDSREEADRIFAELSKDGKVEMDMQEMFWGDYFGSFQEIGRASCRERVEMSVE